VSFQKDLRKERKEYGRVGNQRRGANVGKKGGLIKGNSGNFLRMSCVMVGEGRKTLGDGGSIHLRKNLKS